MAASKHRVKRSTLKRTEAGAFSEGTSTNQTTVEVLPKPPSFVMTDRQGISTSVYNNIQFALSEASFDSGQSLDLRLAYDLPTDWQTNLQTPPQSPLLPPPPPPRISTGVVRLAVNSISSQYSFDSPASSPRILKFSVLKDESKLVRPVTLYADSLLGEDDNEGFDRPSLEKARHDLRYNRSRRHKKHNSRDLVITSPTMSNNNNTHQPAWIEKPPRPSQASKPQFAKKSHVVAAPKDTERLVPSSVPERQGSKHQHGPSSPPTSSSSSSPRSKSKKSKVPLDTIDKLDVTGMYGRGSFHHDGPFDACRPHRNKRLSKAPVAAFPVNGANNTLSGGNDVSRSHATEDRIFARGEDEAFKAFSSSTVSQHEKQQEQKKLLANKNNNNNANNTITTSRIGEAPVLFDPAVKANPVHGDKSLGLGTSTFLEGTPVPQSHVAKDAEASQQQQQQQGLSRKKSFVQRLRRGNSSAASSGNPLAKGRGGVSSAAGTTTDDSKAPSSSAVPPTPTPAASGLAEVSLPDVVSFTPVEHHTGEPEEAVTRRTPPPPPSSAPKESMGSGLLRRVKSLKVGGSSRRTAA